MIQIVAPVLLILSGVCLYGGINHLSAALYRPVDRAQLLFSVFCLLLAPFPVFHAFSLQAETVAELVPVLKWTLGLGLAAFFVLPWYVAAYTGVRPKALLVTSSAVFAVLMLVNIVAPFSMQFASLEGMRSVALPWGETVRAGHGEASVWMLIAFIAWMGVLFFAMYALWLRFRRLRQGADLVILAAVGVFLLTTLQGFMVRLGLIDGTPGGAIGYFVMTIVMSVMLSRDTRQRLESSDRRFRWLVEQSPYSIRLLATDGTTRQVNSAWQSLFGSDASQVVGRSVFEDSGLLAGGVIPYIRRGFAGETVEIPPLRRHGDPAGGAERWIGARIYPIRDEQGVIRDVILMHEDITAKKQVEDAIRLISAGVAGATGERFFRQLVASLAQIFEARYAFIGVLDENDRGRVNTLAVNAGGHDAPDMSYALTDTPCANVVGRNACIYPSGVQQLFPRDVLLQQMSVDSYVGAPLFDSTGAPMGLIVVMDTRPLRHAERAAGIIDIFAARAAAEIQRIRAETHIYRMAYFDFLTGLGSRASFHERLAGTVRELGERGGQCALLLIDLDHFKTINDALSHDVGDSVLKAVADVLTAAVGERAFLARLGGDEFAILAHPRGEHGLMAMSAALVLAQQVLDSLKKPLLVGQREFMLGASVGAVMLSGAEGSGQDVVRHADMALYRAKRLGRGNIQFYTPELQEVVADRLRLEEGLRRALHNGELQLHFQPQVDDHGSVLGAEALLRWTHPELGAVAPSVFIPVAEEAGLIYGIGQWVLEQACDHISRWRRAGLASGGHLSINVSAWQFTRPDFVEQIRQVLDTRGVEPGSLLLELTESAVLFDLHDAAGKLRQLRAMGLKIGLDDFGTGYSSLAHLRDLPLDQLKIDMSFVAELNPAQEHPLVESMVAIGQHMHLAVIAEGVETDVQLAMLKGFGCRGFQGYLIGYPMPEAQFLDWLTRAAPGRVIPGQGTTDITAPLMGAPVTATTVEVAAASTTSSAVTRI